MINDNSVISKFNAFFCEALVTDHYFYFFPLQKELVAKMYSRIINSYMRYI